MAAGHLRLAPRSRLRSERFPSQARQALEEVWGVHRSSLRPTVVVAVVVVVVVVFVEMLVVVATGDGWVGRSTLTEGRLFPILRQVVR